MAKEYEPIPCPTCGQSTKEKRRALRFSKADKISWDYITKELDKGARIWPVVTGGFIMVIMILTYLHLPGCKTVINQIASFFNAANPENFWMYTTLGTGAVFMLVACWRIHKFKKRLRNDKKNLLLKHGWEGEKEGEYVVYGQ